MTTDITGVRRRVCSLDYCSSIHSAKGYCKIHYLRWLRHGDPEIRLRNANGEGSIHKYGYRLVTKDGKQRLEHVIIAETVLGRHIQGDECVHHIDKNKLNNDNSNLLVCPDDAYHHLIHRRQRAIDACGNADWRKCVFCKEYDDPINLYINNRSCFHRACHNLYKRNQRGY